MKKTFEYDLTKFSPDAPTRTEEFLTADGVKTLTTDANDGAVLLQNSVDKDSLNPVTAAAVSAAIEAGGGGGTEYSAGDGISIDEGEISAKVDGTTIGVNSSGELEALGGGGFESPVCTHGVAVAADGSYFGDQGAVGGTYDPYFKRSTSGTEVWAVGITSNKLRMAYPWSYSMDNDGYKVAVFLQGRSSTDLTGYVPTWFPTSNDSMQLRYLGNIIINDGVTANLRDWQNPIAPYINISVCRVRNILPPPSAKPNMEVDTSLWAKVGDWSSITSPITDWRFGFFNPTSEQLLPIDGNNYPAYVYHPNWLVPQHYCGVDIPRADPNADEGKVLKIVNGAPAWVTP